MELIRCDRCGAARYTASPNAFVGTECPGYGWSVIGGAATRCGGKMYYPPDRDATNSGEGQDEKG